MKNNLILSADSYKYSQWPQYPDDTRNVYSYIESRGGKWDEGVFFGLQAFLLEYLAIPITIEDIDEAEAVITAHGEPFNRDGWEYILHTHDGYLPLEIRAVPEGTVVPVKNILACVEATDKECYWLPSFMETALLRAVWYGTTVATNSYQSKKLILSYLVKSGTPETIDFKLHDFGARGVSSLESAGIGGCAHLVNFKGTDTVTGLMFARKYYGEQMAGFSIPAMEHSTVTSWGRVGEYDSFSNMLSLYGKPGAIVAFVSDSYDFEAACHMWGTRLKDQVISSGATVVIRPDSGDPATVVTKGLKILDQYFGHTINEKGYKVLNHVRIIQGDGITADSIRHILFCAVDIAGYSADNIAFGQGGALLQQVDRDTMKFAMKCSAIQIGDIWKDVYKDPITDAGKTSKRGRLDLKKINGALTTVREDEGINATSELNTVFKNGKLYNTQTLAEIRERAKIIVD